MRFAGVRALLRGLRPFWYDAMKSILRPLLILAGIGTAAFPAFGAEQTFAVPAALDRPALHTPKARNVALLAITHAGTRLVTSGERGTILYSDDQGQTWQQADTPTNASLVALRFVDDKHGWAVGHMGLVLHTEDAGKTWSKQLDGIKAAQLALESAQKSGDEKKIAQAQALVADGPDKPFFDLCFLNDKTGFIVGAYNLAFRTDDGGKTWQDWSAHIDNPKGFHLYAMSKAGSSFYIVGEQGLVLRSDDGGQSFKPQPSPYKGTWFGLTSLSNDGLLLYGLRGNAFLSRDQGKTWKQIDTGMPVSISAAIELNDKRLVLVNQAGQVLMSQANSTDFTALPKIPLPIAAVASAGDGLALATLRGVVKLPFSPTKQ